ANCGESPQSTVMMRKLKPEEQLREGNNPWERKFEGKPRLHEQKPHKRPDGWIRLLKVSKSDTSSRVRKVDVGGAG
ncbi:MAG: hypothetical protein MR890_05150, partial [Akkermansia muciniphila]|nr:hypothetical protein [Akkermansia muciniphila]